MRIGKQRLGPNVTQDPYDKEQFTVSNQSAIQFPSIWLEVHTMAFLASEHSSCMWGLQISHLRPLLMNLPLSDTQHKKLAF
jgi:hypothetical protein